MKIAMLAEPYVEVPPQKYGGTERVIYFLIKGLMERGHEVTLLAPGDSQVPCKLIPICEKHLSKIPASSATAWRHTMPPR